MKFVVTNSLVAAIAMFNSLTCTADIDSRQNDSPGWSQPPMTEGYHLYFDGDDDIATIGPFPGLLISTLEAWIRPTRRGALEDDGVAEGTVVVNGGGPGNFCGIGLGLYAAQQSICLDADPAGCGNDIEICVLYESDAQWLHLAGTYDGNSIRLYLNGKLINQRHEVKFDPGDWMTLGAYQFYNGNQAIFAGEMDEVRIWNIARSAEDIRSTMFTRLTGKEEGLVAYWNFDEGNGNRFRNLAGDRYHGYLGGNSPLRTDVPKWVPSNGSLGQPGFDVKKAPIQY